MNMEINKNEYEIKVITLAKQSNVVIYYSGFCK